MKKRRHRTSRNTHASVEPGLRNLGARRGRSVFGLLACSVLAFASCREDSCAILDPSARGCSRNDNVTCNDRTSESNENENDSPGTLLLSFQGGLSGSYALEITKVKESPGTLNPVLHLYASGPTPEDPRVTAFAHVAFFNLPAAPALPLTVPDDDDAPDSEATSFGFSFCMAAEGDWESWNGFGSSGGTIELLRFERTADYLRIEGTVSFAVKGDQLPELDATVAGCLQYEGVFPLDLDD